MKIKSCLICKKEFVAKGDWHKRPRKFCSRKCYDIFSSIRMKENEYKRGLEPWNKGLTKETNEIVKKYGENGSKVKKGKHYSPNTEFKKGIIPWIKGKIGIIKHSEETKKRMSKNWNGKKGAECNLWKGGISSENQRIKNSIEYKQWRKSVFERDKYICIWCGQRGGKLHADHIKPFAYFPELRFEINNGRTLCVDCHEKTDTYQSLFLKRKGIATHADRVYFNPSLVIVEHV